MKTIVVATDGSAASDPAVDEAIELARRFGERLVAAIAVKPSFPSRTRSNGARPVPSVAACTRADVVGAELVARAAAAGVDASAVVAAGLPAAEICRIAAEHDARIVVLGCHRRGAAGRLVFGSVSRAVFEHSARPVLVVPPITRPAQAPRRAAAGQLD